MSVELPPESGPGSATITRFVRAAWGFLIRNALLELDGRLEDVEAAIVGTWRGDWDAETDYNAGDIVQHEGGSWRASEAIPATSPPDEPGSSPSSWVQIAAPGGANLKRPVGITIDAGASDITTGFKGAAPVDFSGTIIGWTLISTDDEGSPVPATGSIVIDVWKSASYPLTDADSITGGNEPELSSEQEASDTTLAGWSTEVSEGDYFGFNVVSVSGLKRVTLRLTVLES